MQILIKDSRGTPSFTETATALTFILLLIAMLMVLFKGLHPSYILWFLLPFGLTMGFRFNKKFKIGKDGLDISQDISQDILEDRDESTVRENKE